VIFVEIRIKNGITMVFTSFLSNVVFANDKWRDLLV